MNTTLSKVQNWPELAQKADWKARNLARLCGVSLRSLEVWFLRTNAVSPKHWLCDQRRQRAIEFLKAGVSVKETASLLGYRYPHHLSRELKKNFGLNPTQFMGPNLSMRVLV
jgi:transcriptional regulator GlxA family with amidase domain